MSKAKLPVIGITIGDVSGIGPEIVKKALKCRRLYKMCLPIVIGNPNEIKVRPGKVNAKAGYYAMDCIKDAVNMALAENIDAIVTAPISKEAIHLAGYNFEGHTDFLAYLTGTKEYSMMFVSPKIKVVLVTIHLKLKDVAKKINKKSVIRAIKHARLAGKLLKIKNPKIAVCALNPHGGEIGDEEKKIIIPAIREFNKKNACPVRNRGKAVISNGVKGPFPADSLFYKVLNNEFDIVVAMYHDQGLVPFKMLEFMEGVNVTLGLPFIRTSPDHGTAFDIAGKNKADPSSMIRAISLAAKMANDPAPKIYSGVDNL